MGRGLHGVGSLLSTCHEMSKGDTSRSVSLLRGVAVAAMARGGEVRMTRLCVVVWAG